MTIQFVEGTISDPAEQLAEARTWIADAYGRSPWAWTDEQVRAFVEHGYTGGWDAFVNECCTFVVIPRTPALPEYEESEYESEELPLPHADYPHDPGTLYDCPGCEAECNCTGYPGDTQCVFCAQLEEAF